MGYSVPSCHLCGVDFNIGRLRNLEEAQAQPTLPPALLADVARYIENARCNAFGCNGGDGMDGCMSLAYKPPGREAEEEEHIPGPDCTHKGGYMGQFISLQEMHGCSTVQCLVPKPGNWESEDDDEEIERHGDFFLSGLCDYMPSRDMEWLSVSPPRHECGDPLADNYKISDEDVLKMAMPFHTACFEVFKRASLHRSGTIDVQGLMDWFRIEADSWSFELFPRSAAVNRGRNQWWIHCRGDEHLVANPCFVPGLQELLKIHVKSSINDGYSGREASVFGATAPSSFKAERRFAKLPCELRILILFELETPDIINLRLASRTFRHLPQSVFHTLLQRRKPWLWEVWCELPYSFWAATTCECLAREEASWLQEKAAFGESVDELSEGSDHLSEAQEQGTYSLKQEFQQAAEARDDWQKDVNAPLLPSMQTDWCGIFVEVEKRRNSILGLMNRERIWKDCEEILDRIENCRRGGRIRPALELVESPCSSQLQTTPATPAG